MRVLYVEDHPVNVEVMRAIFALRPDLTLDVAVDGASGLNAATRHAPDLLLLDLRLPDCHGTALLSQLRELPSTTCTPAIAVTAEDAPDLTRSTFLETWPKPLNIRQVLVRLDQLYAHHVLQRSSAAVPA
ncbi:MAG: response regulator [Aquabacterium sp.]